MGIDEDVFWNLTLRQYLRRLEAWTQADKDDTTRVRAAAWWTASLMRQQKRMPSFERWMKDPKTTEPKTPEQIAQYEKDLEEIKQRFGVTGVIKRPKK